MGTVWWCCQTLSPTVPLWEGPCSAQIEIVCPEGWIGRSTKLGKLGNSASKLVSKNLIGGFVFTLENEGRK